LSIKDFIALFLSITGKIINKDKWENNIVSDDCDCRFVEVIDIDKTISDHKATKLYLKIPDVIHKSYQRLLSYITYNIVKNMVFFMQ
jgi:hypothetical protein